MHHIHQYGIIKCNYHNKSNFRCVYELHAFHFIIFHPIIKFFIIYVFKFFYHHARLGIQFLEAYLACERKKSFDVIICSAVLEHTNVRD